MTRHDSIPQWVMSYMSWLNMTPYHSRRYTRSDCRERLCCAAHCNSLQHTATHCNTLRSTETVGSDCVVQHTAPHCNTLQHTATHCNTLRSTETVETDCVSLSEWVMSHIFTSHNTHMKGNVYAWLERATVFSLSRENSTEKRFLVDTVMSSHVTLWCWVMSTTRNHSRINNWSKERLQKAAMCHF